MFEIIKGLEGLALSLWNAVLYAATFQQWERSLIETSNQESFVAWEALTVLFQWFTKNKTNASSEASASKIYEMYCQVE